MAKNSMDLLELLRNRGMDGDVDFLREALQVLVEGIMDAEVAAQIGAQRGERNPERVTHRNGYRTDPGTLGWAPWSCGSPRSGRAVISQACWNPGDAVSGLC